MDWLNVTFPVSGAEVNLLVPPMVALVISFFASLSGLSGAFLVMAYMISGLGFAGPPASATNFVFNIAAIPSGVYNFTRQRRVLWPMVLVVTLGTLPGLAVGYFIRMRYLPDPVRFKVFVGFAFLFLAIRLLQEITGKGARGPAVAPGALSTISSDMRKVVFKLGEQEFSFRPIPLFVFSLGVGVVGGTYGLGGGVLVVPFLVAFEGLPIYAIAGGAILSTFLASVAGVFVYSYLPIAGAVAGPDWALGLLFGAGGACGVYLGSRAQRHVPEKLIRIILFIILSGLAIKYISGIADL